jgi:Spy/CpxP family protein refolding chaperone
LPFAWRPLPSSREFPVERLRRHAELLGDVLPKSRLRHAGRKTAARRWRGLAKAAELNGMPGPSHVLDMASELSLSAEQVERTRKIRDAMRREAKTIGERFVANEAVLETRFRAGDIGNLELETRVAEIESIRAELRTAHLSAHIEMTRVLSAEQVRRYATLRGYR